MNKKNLLILGGSHSELPLIRAARTFGLDIFTSGNRPDHPGHELADNYYPGDFSDAEAMIELARRIGCNYIVSAANDYAYLSACSVAEALDLPGFDPRSIAELLHHKHCFKPLASELGLPITRFITYNFGDVPHKSKGLRYPLVVKPVDLTGGKGISVVYDEIELQKAITLARSLSKHESLVIEEYFQGTLHSYSTIIENGKVIFDYADNEYCHPSTYLVSTSSSIASVPPHILTDLRFQTEKIASRLKLVDGVLHCQFLYKDHDYVILEFTRRCSGDLYSDVVEAVTGVRHAEQFVRASLGFPMSISRTTPVGSFVSRHCIFPDRPGYFNGLEIDEALSHFLLSVTEVLPRSNFFDKPYKEKAAVVILSFPTHGIMLENQPLMNLSIRCRITGAFTKTPGKFTGTHDVDTRL
jgi:biotin carboxylase